MRLLGKLLLGAAVLGGVMAYFRLNTLLREAIEHYGSQATGTTVTVRAVSISPISGTGRLSGLAVANPPGYSEESALSVEDVRVKLAPASLLSGTIMIREVVVASPWIRWEVRLGETNLGRLRRTLETPAGKGGKPKKVQDSGRRVVIEHFIVRDARLKVASAVGGASEVALPDLRLRDLGKKGGGATTREVVAQALDAVFRSAIEGAGGASALQSAGKSIVDTLGGLFRKKKR